MFDGYTTWVSSVSSSFGGQCRPYSTLKMDAHCISDTLATLSTCTPCNHTITELISPIKLRECLKPMRNGVCGRGIEPQFYEK
jgi:hypothetical protein